MGTREFRYTNVYKKKVWLGALQLDILEEDVFGENISEEVQNEATPWSFDGLLEAEWWPQFIEGDSL